MAMSGEDNPCALAPKVWRTQVPTGLRSNVVVNELIDVVNRMKGARIVERGHDQAASRDAASRDAASV
jgi:hypothetical protein